MTLTKRRLARTALARTALPWTAFPRTAFPRTALPWTTALALLLGVLLWARRPAAHARFRPAPLPAEYLDQGLACLAEGSCEPRLEALSDRELGRVAEVIGRLLHAYLLGAFDSFLALRSGDLDFATRARAEDLWQLRALARELGSPDEDLRGDWIQTLRRFWEGYYGEPPIARFVHERCTIALHRGGLGGRSLADWSRSFEALRDRERGPTIQHELTVPHRRGIERVAGDAGPLRWLDLELAFEGRTGGRGRLVTRFVWDAVLEEWFLHAAATVYAPGDRTERHLIL